MDRDARVRGWKRFRPQDAQVQPKLPERAGESVMTRFEPLAAGSVFEGKLRIHNLLPEELGALLWAADFGGAANAFHTLGMARPLGYGRVTLRVVPEALERNGGGRVDPEVCRRAFVAEMERAAREVPGGWAGSEQLQQLIACARPIPKGSDEGRYMWLDHPVERNEFVAAKREGLILEPAARVTVKQVPAPGASRSAPRSAPKAEPKGPDEVERARLEQAFHAGQHIPILVRWVAEAGPREGARRKIAKEVVLQISKKLKRDHPDVVAWLEA